MNSVTLKEAICQEFDLKEQDFVGFVLRKTLFKRVLLVFPVVKVFFPDFLFNERRLVEKIADATNLTEIQDEVDFYQHKFVVNFVMKEALRFRISGMKIMRLANRVFQSVRDDANKEAPVQLPTHQ
ncbi:MAG: hypothetical protein ACO3ZW_06530 [Opitutales bacterium]|jgi:hypothetical protein